MLACVRDVAEALLALAGGVDAVQLEDPAPDQIREAVAAVAGRCRIGATVMQPTAEQVSAYAACGVDHLLLPAPQYGFSAGQPGIDLIALLDADAPHDEAVLHQIAGSGCSAVLLRARRLRLLSQCTMPALARFVAAAHASGLRVGLAGGLEPPDIPRLLVLCPDLLAFRRALLSPGRGLSAEATARIRRLIPRTGGAETADVAPGQDRIFVHDLVLPVRVGAYAQEHQAPQLVRFNIDVMITRPPTVPQDMGDIVSYDLITDAIRLLVDAGHTRLLETLAERIAGMLLAHPRVRQVRVSLEKRQQDNGVMGITIERSKEDLLF